MDWKDEELEQNDEEEDGEEEKYSEKEEVQHEVEDEKPSSYEENLNLLRNLCSSKKKRRLKNQLNHVGFFCAAEVKAVVIFVSNRL